MGGVATCISLSARAWSTTTLSFGTSGIISNVAARLGQFIPAFAVTGFYKVLEAAPTVSTDASSLLYTSAQIDTYVAPYVLANLQAENKRATLDQAILARQNAYFSKYQNATEIVNVMSGYYDLSTPGTKANVLMQLAEDASTQYRALIEAYNGDGRSGVVKSTTSSLTSTSSLNSNVMGSSNTQETGEDTGASLETVVPDSGFPTLPSAPQGGGWGFSGLANMNATEEEEQSGVTSGTTSQSTENSTSTETQNVTNTDYGYRYPLLESQAQLYRALISLGDEYVAAFLAAQALSSGNLPTVYANELSTIDSKVYQLQIGYLNSYLLPSIGGYVTGVYKNPGEWAQAGEPVVRIEDWDRLYILASIKYSGVITTLNTSVSIATLAPGTPEVPVTLDCAVVSVRGGKDERQYDLILSVDNVQNFPANIFPPGHKFILDATTVTVVDTKV